jgi:predicted dehydrogenase
MNRRYFLMSAAAGAAVRATALGSPNDTIRVAVVGLRGQGNGHIRAYQRMPNVEIAALVDIDESILDRRLAEVEKATGKAPARYIDIRKMLDDKSIDCVSIATPNHHHTLADHLGLQAGKHVYVEKPCSHNVFESRQIVAARANTTSWCSTAPTAARVRRLREAVEKLRRA